MQASRDGMFGENRSAHTFIEAQMTNKQKIAAVIDQLPDNASFDQAIEELTLLAAIQDGIDQLDRGEGIPHEQVVAELLRREQLHGKN
jgi:predicted transcriptional regulator